MRLCSTQDVDTPSPPRSRRPPCANSFMRARKRKGKREYLNDAETRSMMKELNGYFESRVEVPRIRVGKRQTIETLINDETLLLAKFLRNERKTWIPRLTLGLCSSEK